MIATLIPYFLVCNITAGSDWPYGPEYVYNVSGNTTIQRDIASPTVIVKYYTTIHCRPKSVATLSCILNNVTTSSENSGLRKDSYIPRQKRFEVDFNEFGAENLTMPSDANATDQSFMTFFAPLFTVGSDLSGKTEQDGAFQTMYSSVERFKMNVKIGYPPETEEDKMDKPYELEILPGVDKPIGKAIEITKVKNDELDDDYQSVEDPSPSGERRTITFFQHIEQLKYRMKISKHSFESYTYERMLSVVGSGMKTIYDTHFEIRLTDVVPADEPIPEILEPTTYSIFYE